MKPILFSIGPFHLYSFGLMVALGVLLSIFLARRRAARTGIFSPDTAVDLIFVTVFAGFAGGRVLYVLQEWTWYAEHFLEIFYLWEGGLIFYGGVVGSLAGLWIFTELRSKGARPCAPTFFGVLDFLLPYVALTHAFGRVGCFLNGCCTGRTCYFPWAVKFPNLPEAVHPTQLYEALFLFTLFLFLNARYEKKTKGPGPFLGPGPFRGEITALYFGFYAVGRFFIESLRDGNPFWGPLTVNQWWSGVIFAAAWGVYFLCRHKKS